MEMPLGETSELTSVTIGDEVHTVDQVLTFTSGIGKATINGKDQDVKAGDLVV